jgi:predicted unusual protein kinase regulating ubiquinone biosynthesis (AarF/ABC1/UbiB family)
MYVKVEEFVHGKTLVRPEELEGHDLKQVVSLIVKHHVRQIMQPIKVAVGEQEPTISIVHSDVHPGNFMVGTDTGDGKFVAVIDRNNYLELDAADRALVVSLVAAGSATAQIEQFITYLEKQQASPVDPAHMEALKSALSESMSDETPISERVMKIKKAAAQRGWYVPLKLTLLIKNMNGLEALCRNAGLTGGIQEALMYSPGK